MDYIRLFEGQFNKCIVDFLSYICRVNKKSFVYHSIMSEIDGETGKEGSDTQGIGKEALTTVDPKTGTQIYTERGNAVKTTATEAVGGYGSRGMRAMQGEDSVPVEKPSGSSE